MELSGAAVVGRHRKEAVAVVGLSIQSASQPLWGGACDVVRLMNSANQASSCDSRALDIMQVNQDMKRGRLGSGHSLYLAVYDLNQNEFVEEMSEDEDSGSSGSNEVAKPNGNVSGGSGSGSGGSGSGGSGSAGTGSGSASKTSTSQAGGSTKLVLGTGTSKSSPGTRQDHHLFQEMFLSKFLYDSPLIQDGDGIIISSGATCMMNTLGFTPASNLYKNSEYTMITSPVNLGSNAGSTTLVAPSIFNGYIADSKKACSNNKVTVPLKWKACEPVAVQCISLPEPYCNCTGLSIKGIYPSKDGKHVFVVLVDSAFLSDVYNMCSTNCIDPDAEWSEMSRSVILVYALDASGGVIRVEKTPVRMHQLADVGETPVEVVLFPLLDDTRKDLHGIIALVGVDGTVRVLDLNTQRYIAQNQPPVGTKFVSATFCNSELISLPVNFECYKDASSCHSTKLLSTIFFFSTESSYGSYEKWLAHRFFYRRKVCNAA